MFCKYLRLVLRVFFILCIPIYIGSVIIPEQPVDASSAISWYNQAWQYRKELVIYGSNSGIQTDYQKKIRVYENTTDVSECVAQYTTGMNFLNPSVYGAQWIGQTFTAETSGTIRKVWVKLAKVGSPTASVACAIRATSGGLPTGANLCSGNITSSYLSSNTTTLLGSNWYEFDMGTGTTITKGSTYAYFLYSTSCNITNCVAVGQYINGLYTGGAYVYSLNNGSSWSTAFGYDNIFQVITDTSGSTPLRVSCNGHCQPDFDDIRFTSSDGVTELSYWIENYETRQTDGYADIWVKIPSIPQMTGTTESTTIYMYYGNSSVYSTSNGTNTFEQFDDFDSYTVGTDINGQGGWTATAGLNTISNTVAFSGTQSLRGNGNVSNNVYRTLLASNQTWIIGCKLYKTNGADFATMIHGDAVSAVRSRFASAESVFAADQATSIGTGRANEWTTWLSYSHIWGASSTSSSAIVRYKDSANEFAAISSTYNSASYNNIIRPYTTYITAGGEYIYLDDFFVAKFAATQPLWSTIGTETTQPELIIQDVKIFTGYKENEDWLICIRYINKYPPYYDTYDVRKYFQLQLVDNGTVYASTPMPAWGNKVGCIYLSAIQASVLTYGKAYNILLYGTFTGNPYFSYTLQAGDWLGGDLSNLDSWIITSAAVIGNYYSDTYTTYISGRGEVLNAAGSTIFSNGISGLMIERPEIFQVYTIPNTSSPNVTDQTYRKSLSNWQESWGEDGVIMLQRLANIVNIDPGFLGGMLFVAMMIILGITAFPAGHTTAANVLSIGFLILGIVFGLDLIYVILLAIVSAFLLFKNMFMDK